MADFITPLIAAMGGKPNFGGLTFTINGSRFRHGHLINAALSFLITAAVIFFRQAAEPAAGAAQGGGPEPGAPAGDVRLLTEIRDLLRERGGAY